MKAKKFILFMVPVTLFITLISFLTLLAILNKSYKPNDFKDKVYLLKNNPSIFFAGDSRAERQLNPIVASIMLNENNNRIVNIANSSADVVMVSEFIKEHKEKFKDSTVFISVSSFEINDGATKPGYISDTSFSKLTPLEQLQISKNHPKNLFNFVVSNLKSVMKNTSHYGDQNALIDTLGFNPIEGVLQGDSLKINNQQNNPWYENWNSGGLRYKIFEKSIIEINKNVNKLYIYTAPYSPQWRKVMFGTKEYNHEIEFNHLVADICQNNNIKYINYYDNEDFENIDFYDPAHLNKDGANKFTRLVISNFIEDK